MNEGRYLEARILFTRTLKHATTWNIDDIVALHRAGLRVDAETLRLQTVKYAKWCVDDVLALHKAGLGFAAWLLHCKTLKYVKSWRLDDVILLQAAGLPAEARLLFGHTLLFARWSVSDVMILVSDIRTRTTQGRRATFGASLVAAQLAPQLPRPFLEHHGVRFPPATNRRLRPPYLGWRLVEYVIVQRCDLFCDYDTKRRDASNHHTVPSLPSRNNNSLRCSWPAQPSTSAKCVSRASPNKGQGKKPGASLYTRKRPSRASASTACRSRRWHH